MPPSPVTLKDIAHATGLSVSAVSYALRGAPNVPPETAARVRAEAERLGYRMNARVSELMARIRGGRRPGGAERLALVWLETAGELGDFAGEVAAGARRRATECGYRLDEFWLDEAGGNPRRLANILHARGIPGIVFGPVVRRERVELDWPWERFAMAVIGTAAWNVPLSRAAHHHFEAMRLALDGLAKTGSRRPAAVLDRVPDERAHRGWQAAWLAYAPAPAPRRLLMAGEPPPSRAALAVWLRSARPDGLVLTDSAHLPRLRAAGWSGPDQHVASLAWRSRENLPGVDQGYATISGHAVDLVVSQLHRNERGLHDAPKTLLFPGRWMATS